MESPTNAQVIGKPVNNAELAIDPRTGRAQGFRDIKALKGAGGLGCDFRKIIGTVIFDGGKIKIAPDIKLIAVVACNAERKFIYSPRSTDIILLVCSRGGKNITAITG